MKFFVSSAKEVMDPYEWLPGFGENEVKVYSQGSSLSIEVKYESDDDHLCKRIISFSGVCSFYKSLFPGAAGLINISYDCKWKVGSLIEFQYSDVANAWSSYLDNRSKIKHYLIQFTEENEQIHIIASSYCLSDEIPIS
jgi:hypothetical protein